MKIIFDTEKLGVAGYTSDPEFVPTERFVLADIPAGWDERFRDYAAIEAGALVVDSVRYRAAAAQQAAGAIKVSAQEQIAALAWRLERAQERAKIGAPGETVAQVLTEREAVRRASNRAELEVQALTDIAAIEAFTWEVTTADYPVSTLVTRLAFLSRFTDAEAVAIDLAGIGETAEAASVRRYVNKIEAAAFIDLSREDTRSGVQALEALGILAAGRAAEILDAPILPHEVPQ